jgi:hypothetical protein
VYFRDTGDKNITLYEIIYIHLSMHIILNNMNLKMRVANFCRSSGFLCVVSFYCFKKKLAWSSLYPEYVWKKCKPKVFT